MASETRLYFLSGAAVAYVSMMGYKPLPRLVRYFVPIMLSKVDIEMTIVGEGGFLVC